MKPTVIFGASRHGAVVLEILRARGGAEVLGFLDDDAAKHGSILGGLRVLGGIDWVSQWGGDALAAIVAIGNNDVRLAVGDRLRVLGLELINAIHPSSVVATDVTLGTGSVICPGAILVTGTRLENDVIVNTAASLDHDTLLCTGAQIGPGVHTAGNVTVGRCAFIGVGAILGPHVTIGERTVVGAGSVVLQDLPAHVLAVGTPARVVRELGEPLNWRHVLGGE